MRFVYVKLELKKNPRWGANRAPGIEYYIRIYDFFFVFCYSESMLYILNEGKEFN